MKKAQPHPVVAAVAEDRHPRSVPAGGPGQARGCPCPGPSNPSGRVGDLITIRPALESLAARGRRLLRLRFVDNLSQEQIGRQLGVSQMQISRMLNAILRKLRHSIQERQVA